MSLTPPSAAVATQVQASPQRPAARRVDASDLPDLSKSAAAPNTPTQNAAVAQPARAEQRPTRPGSLLDIRV